MSEAELMNLMWFQPWHFFLYLFFIFVVMVVYYQWRWAKTCKENIQVLVAQTGGGGDFRLAPKTSAGEISLKNPNSDSVRTWALNELATIEVPYPGVGFVPTFLQKTIRLAIVNEGDWEPMLNRSPHMEKVASPDVVDFLIDLSHQIEDDPTRKRIEKLVSGISTGSTREMIASPAVLGNLIHEKITESVMTVNKEVMDRVEGLMRRLNKLPSSTIVYVGLGLALVGIIVIIAQLNNLQGSQEVLDKLDTIQKALGKMAIDEAKVKKIRRAEKAEEDIKKDEAPAVSAGRIDKLLDLLYNPSRDAIRGVTIIDRLQGRLFPQLDMVSLGRRYVLEIAAYRQNKEIYKKVFKQDRPVPPDLIDELQYRTAQWGRSVAGKSFERGIDISLAEMEGKAC